MKRLPPETRAEILRELIMLCVVLSVSLPIALVIRIIGVPQSGFHAVLAFLLGSVIWLIVRDLMSDWVRTGKRKRDR